MNHAVPLVPAAKLVKRNTRRFPAEGDDHHRASDALRAGEIEP